jgi:methylthioribose-1-phosphate isomerase
MAASSVDETREPLIGTWTAVAMIMEMLIEQELVSREELMMLLSKAEAATHDRRSTAIAGLRLLVERGFG